MADVYGTFELPKENNIFNTITFNSKSTTSASFTYYLRIDGVTQSNPTLGAPIDIKGKKFEVLVRWSNTAQGTYSVNVTLK